MQEVRVLRSNQTLCFHERLKLDVEAVVHACRDHDSCWGEILQTSSCIPFQSATQTTMASSPHSGGRFLFKTTFKYVCNRGRLRVTALFLNDYYFATQQVKLAYTR